MIRINRYYPARGQTDSYADFSRKPWIARLGMMSDPAADQKIGVLAEALPETLDVTVQVDGRLQKLNAIPWGLIPNAEITAVPDLARFQVALKKHAPTGWTGTAHIAFLMQNAGADTRAKFTVRSGARSAR